MPEDLLSLEITDHARTAYGTLGSEDRRVLDAWFEHLRNLRNDEFIRAKSRRLGTDEEYAIPTGTGFFIAFEIVADRVIVQSIFREEALRKFHNVSSPSTR